MKERRDFIKAVAVGTGALSLPAVVYAQNSGYIPPVITFALDEEPGFVTAAAASGGAEVTTEP